jgi:hypothetical protein
MDDRWRVGRREALKALSACVAGGAAAASGLFLGCDRFRGSGPAQATRRASALTRPEDRRFLVVLGCLGGASILDSFLAIRASESRNAATLNTFPDAVVQGFDGSPLRAVDLKRDSVGAIPFAFESRQSEFVRSHKDDMMVVTVEGTSVNHAVAQKRSVTGNNAWNGRTLQECVAEYYGADLPLANVNMSIGGLAERGSDVSLPAAAYHEQVAQPRLLFVGMDGVRGIKDAPDRALVDAARRLRNETLDPQSTFYRTFAKSARLKRWMQHRSETQPALEARDLITKLNPLADTPQVPLAAYGLASSPDGEKVREQFPDMLADPLQAKAALTFLLIKYQVSVTVTLSPTFDAVLPSPSDLRNPPIAFDFSHQANRSTQAFMWRRALDISDRLIRLLQSEPFLETGQSLWDRTMIYCATDFGRSVSRPANADEFGTGHHLENGVLVLSPFVRGNSVLGGVHADTAEIHGFDLQTGRPDSDRKTSEAELFSGLLGALKVDTAGSGLPDVPAMRRG